MDELYISSSQESYVLLTAQGSVFQVLSAGMMFLLQLRGKWQRVQLCSGGYRGCYYQTETGERGRLAVSMRAQCCELALV